jgi:hypothetical protein
VEKRWITILAIGFGFWSLMAGSASAGEKNVAEEILDILRANGQITEQQYDVLIEKARGEREALPTVAAEEKASWIDRVTLFGDFRGRYEGFWYDHDPVGNEKEDRHRLRYRARLGLKAKINEHVDLTMRLATGEEWRSRNQTMGSSFTTASDTEDYHPDGIYVDQAYVSLHPFKKDAIPLGGSKLNLRFGKMPNPFKSKQGKDMLLWDGDLTPEGGAVTFAIDPSEQVGLTFHSGYFVIDENSSSSDPSLLGGQLRTVFRASDSLEFGSNLSYYAYRELNSDFYSRAESSGNIPAGLSHNRDSHVGVGDVRGWLRYSANEVWPCLLYGNFVQNFSAHDTTGFQAGKEDKGWSLGLELGNKKKVAMLGAGYFWVQANAVPANFMDSDLFDGDTNRKGFVIYGARQIYSKTDLKLTLFVGEALDEDITHSPAIADSDRKRLQTDIVVKF